MKFQPVKLGSLFTFDLRSLSLMRIAVALTLLVDLLIRFSNLTSHYSDYGVLPLEALFRLAWNEHFFSFYTLSGSPFIEGVLLMVNLLCILVLLVGYRTRLFTILCWLFLLSIHNRNPLVHQGGDDLLRLLLFGGMFLPWGSYYSLDAEKYTCTETNYFSVAGFAYMLQVGYVYFFSALLKSSPEWTSEFTALYYALSIDQIVLPVGRWIYPYESFLKIMTMVVYYLELCVPLLLLVPVFTTQCRIVFVALIASLHIGISLCLNVGLFPLIGIVSMIGLLPGSFSNAVVRSVASFYPQVVRMIHRLRTSLKPDLDAEILPVKESLQVRLAALFFLVYVFNWNLLTLQAPSLVSYLGNEIAFTLRVDQNWGMFSPRVFKDDGWFVLEATTREQRTIDLLKEGEKVAFVKEASVSGPFREDRWRKFSENILMIRNARLRPYYCDYLIKDWNRNHMADSQKVKELQIIYMKEISLPGYSVEGPSKEILCKCFLE